MCPGVVCVPLNSPQIRTLKKGKILLILKQGAWEKSCGLCSMTWDKVSRWPWVTFNLKGEMVEPLVACLGQPPTLTPMTVKWLSRWGGRVREELNTSFISNLTFDNPHPSLSVLKSLCGMGFSLWTCRNNREAAGRTQVKQKSGKESSGGLLGLQELKRKAD